jgi:hypothetical protein
VKSAAQDRDWHEYECAHEHRWWSAPTSTRCPVCNTSTYKPIKVLHGQIGVMVERKFDA